ncbi:MAG: FxsA family protein [Pseudomonadota bacterium]
MRSNNDPAGDLVSAVVQHHLVGQKINSQTGLHVPIALIPFLLLIVPILEISVFILIGQQIGLWATLGGILLTAILGTILLRWQGLATLSRLRSEFGAGHVPARAMGDGAMLIIAGILLLTPGFVTDAIGFSLFIPAVRGAIFSFFAARVKIVTPFGGGAGQNPQRPRQDGVVDLDETEFHHTQPNTHEPDGPPNRDTPWRDGPK